MAKVSVPQYAKAVGISKVAAYKRVKAGKIRVDENGLVELDEAAAQWEKTRDAVSGAKNPSGLAKSKPVSQPDERSSLAEAQRARAWIRVKREKLAIEKEERQLVRKDEVRNSVSSMIVASRNRLATIADELCDRLAAESDPVRIHKIISSKVDEALLHLSEYPASA